ncbi:MAG: hypothetical protein J7L55_04975 [Desulfurococcales archaeon]|nr:hypothetical protein [Desulfurococcales archaeon]
MIGIAIVLVVAAGAGYYFMSTQPQAPATPASTTTTQQPTSPATTHTTETSAPQTTSSAQTTAPGTYTTTQAPTTSQPATTTETSPTPTPTTTTTTAGASTETTTQTTTTTPSGETVSVEGVELEGLFVHFKKATLTITQKDGSTGEVKVNNISYTQSRTTLNGQEVIKIDLEVNEGEGKSVVAQMWVTPDYKKVLQLNLEGQVIAGQTADMYGQQLLKGFGTMLYAASSVNIKFVISEKEATLLVNGWTLETMTPTKVTISGKTYGGYYFKAVNVADNKSSVASVEGKVANLFGDSYYYVHLEVVEKSNNVYTLTFTELEPWT